MDVTIQTRPALRFAALPHRGSYFDIGPVFPKLIALCPPQGPIEALYHDNPDEVAVADLRSHACVRLSDGAATPDGCEEVTLPAGRDAVFLHKGPYAGLAEAYGAFYGTWLPQSGEVPAELPAREVYLNAPGTVPDAELLTEVHVALR